MMMRYEEPRPIAKSRAEVALKSGKAHEVCDALVRLALHESDWRWVQNKCLELAGDSNSEIRACAATCLGHLARIHKTLDMDKVRPALQQLLSDPTTAGEAEDALDDIGIFLAPKG